MIGNEGISWTQNVNLCDRYQVNTIIQKSYKIDSLVVGQHGLICLQVIVMSCIDREL